jgi:hypothetical protein
MHLPVFTLLAGTMAVLRANGWICSSGKSRKTYLTFTRLDVIIHHLRLGLADIGAAVGALVV